MENSEIFSTLKPVEVKRASEAIYEQIIEMIINGQLKPGDRLPSERAMMGMMNRSRPTIREALRMLERTGFIRTIPGSNGAVVQNMSTKHTEQSLQNIIAMNGVTLEELAEYRMITEVNIASWASQRRTDEDLAILKDIMDKMENSFDNIENFMIHDKQFHIAIANASGNKAAAIISQILTNVSRHFMDTAIETVIQDERVEMCKKIVLLHTKIVNSIEAKDEEAAKQAMCDHINDFLVDLK